MTLTLDDIEEATNGRLAADDTTQRLLDTALELTRRYCGWHVTPEREDSLILDGFGGEILRLPTLNLVDLTEIVEDGVTLDIDELEVSPLGRIRKNSGEFWTDQFSGLAVTMTHGFNNAGPFESAVLGYLVRTAITASMGGLQRTAVGPFSYAQPTFASASAFTTSETMILDLYRLEPTP